MTDQWIIDDLHTSNQSWISAHNALPAIIEANVSDVSRGVEVGIAYGSMCMALLQRFPGLHLVGVDPYEPYDPTDCMSRSQEDMDKLCAFTAARVRDAFGDRFRHSRKPSTEAAEDFEDGSLDFVFIDACHQYEAVKADVSAWSAKVRPGGLICGHDYGCGWPGVMKAVDEFFGSETREFFVDHRSAIWASVIPGRIQELTTPPV